MFHCIINNASKMASHPHRLRKVLIEVLDHCAKAFGIASFGAGILKEQVTM